jgi:ArsR family transcriptional regulator, arsenate/arsenite/antimonite-responsive transcriptional repressor
MPTMQQSQRPALPLLISECCSPVVGGVLTVPEAESLAAVLKAIAEPTRLRLVSLVAAHADAEACVCDLTEPVGLSQPTVFQERRKELPRAITGRESVPQGRAARY